MKRQWDIEGLIEHFPLIEEDLPILSKKNGSSRIPIIWQNVKTNLRAVGLKSVFHEIDKALALLQLALPLDPFEKVSPQVVTFYREQLTTKPSISCVAILFAAKKHSPVRDICK